ncbi:Hsp20/alpha crystallin family protein [Geotalea sp. SG265]|uniref:Hsp20/alpha crystallin family protein n=1 Tax=Geotalea sp. SG265 TaxID=2922867 RepID=UPI001FAEAADE|nr:Hsp20/alpha crystallin family protein [Geotalea sp. SG265]
MRRQTEEMKPATRELEKKPVSSGTYETKPTTIERNILSTLHEMERMFDETIHRPFFGFNMVPFRHMFEELGSFGTFTPTCDIFESGNELVVKSDLPGMSREDVKVTIMDNNLIIEGERKSEEKVERKDYLRVERTHGSFSRRIALPEGIDSEQIKASFKDGVLEIRVPKTETKTSARQIKLE